MSINKKSQHTIYHIPYTKNGFTLIELLVVISIIAILVGISLFGLSGAREAARDARRKSDLESIRSGIELYKADCNEYPAAISAGADLVGDNSPASCAAANKYISGVPTDPTAGKIYRYIRQTTSTYILCALLENAPSPAMPGVGACGSCTAGACNYIVTNP